MAVTCSAIAKSGSRCRRPALAGKQHCLMHDPESAGLRLEASRKGGRARSNKARAAAAIPDALPPDQVAGLLSLLFTQVMTGRIEPKVGTACAAIAGRLLEAQTAAAQPSVADLEEQLAALRALVERGGRGAA